MRVQKPDTNSIQLETIEQLETLMSAWLSNFTSQRTTEAYAWVLNSFLKFVQKFPQDVTQQDVIDYRHHLDKDLKRANTTINSVSMPCARFQSPRKNGHDGEQSS